MDDAIFPLHSRAGHVGGDVATLRTSIGRYIQARKNTGKFTGKTGRDRQYALDAFADYVGPDTALGRVRPKHVEGWLGTLQGATSTKAVRLSNIKCFFDWCVRERLCKHNPCEQIEPPRRPTSQPRGLRAQDVARLLEVADERAYLIVILGCQLGLRRGEVASLTTSSVDWDDRVVYVIGKGSKERVVPLTEEAAEAIVAYLARYPAGPHQPLIRSYIHPQRGMTAQSVGRLVSELFAETGLKRAAWDGKSMHSTRHTCANDMLDHGADLRDVQEMLGHQFLATTANVYARRLHAIGRLAERAAGRRYGKVDSDETMGSAVVVAASPD